MLDEKKIQDSVISMRAYAKLILQETDKIDAMFEVKEPAKVDEETLFRIKFYRRKELSMQRARKKNANKK